MLSISNTYFRQEVKKKEQNNVSQLPVSILRSIISNLMQKKSAYSYQAEINLMIMSHNMGVCEM